MSGERRRRRSSSSGDSAGSSGERAGVQRSERSEVPSGSRVDGERRRSGGGGSSRRRRRGRRMWLWLVPLVLGVLALLLIPWWNERGLRVAEWQLESGDAAGALATVDEYLETQGGTESGLALKARVLVKLGQPAEALRLIERVGAASVPEMRAYAQASLMLQRWTSALPVLEHLVKLEPADGDLLHELSACRARLGRYDESIAAAVQFSKLPGNEARGFTLIGLLERDRGNNQKCAEAWSRVLELRPDAKDLQVSAAEFFQEYGKALLLTGDASKAESALVRGVSAGESAAALAWLGKAQQQLGRRQDSERTWLRAVELEPLNAMAAEGLAELLMQRQDFTGALARLQPLEEQPGLRSSTGFLLQRLYGLLNQPEKSAEWKQRTEKLRRAEEALVHMEQVIVSSPDTMWGRVYQAWYLAEQDNRDQARELLSPFVKEGAEPFIMKLWAALRDGTPLPGPEEGPLDVF
ncbi:MAG: tetratricopeptide repeat protein [Planctomyces sp.]|jgi:tetratricopeptide (TPR) repeat protein